MDPRLVAVPLADAHDVQEFGGKAVSLGAAIRSGLPVPRGVALSTCLVDRVAAGDAEVIAALLAHAHLPSSVAAVRSSAVGEDSGSASFAGQHVTRLNVTRDGMVEAVCDVWQSARSDAALAYRARQNITTEPAIGVVIQALVDSVVAGVLFTRNPMTGADERVIEAGWGLGEVVVSSRIVPDFFRLDVRGQLLESILGDKDVQIVRTGDGGTEERPVADAQRQMLCLDAGRLARLHALAAQCQSVWGDAIDLEFAFGPGDELFLLQSRPITRTNA